MIIGKFHLAITDRQTLEIPSPARILSVIAKPDEFNHEDVLLYAEMEKGAPLLYRKIRIYGTGHEMDEPHTGIFLGTVHTENGQLVWHIYDVTDYDAEHHYGP